MERIVWSMKHLGTMGKIVTARRVEFGSYYKALLMLGQWWMMRTINKVKSKCRI